LITEYKFMEYAKRLVDPTRSNIPEEELRSAISRGYYSLLHETYGILKAKYSFKLIDELKKQKTPSKIDRRKLNNLDKDYLRGFNLHKALPNTLISLGPKYIGIAQQFKAFRIERNNADYDLDMLFASDDSRIMIRDMDNLIQLIKMI